MCGALVPSSVLLKRTHVHVLYACRCVFKCLQRPCVNLSCHSVGDNHLVFFEIVSPIWLGVYQVGYASWPANCKIPPISSLLVLGIQASATMNDLFACLLVCLFDMGSG